MSANTYVPRAAVRAACVAADDDRVHPPERRGDVPEGAGAELLKGSGTLQLLELGDVPLAQDGEQFSRIVELPALAAVGMGHLALDPQASRLGVEICLVLVQGPQVDLHGEPLVARLHGNDPRHSIVLLS